MDIKRIETALIFLKDRQGFGVDNLWLDVKTKELVVTGLSRIFDLPTPTKKRAVAELAEIKTLFQEMISLSSNFKFVLERKSVLSLTLMTMVKRLSVFVQKGTEILNGKWILSKRYCLDRDSLADLRVNSCMFFSVPSRPTPFASA